MSEVKTISADELEAAVKNGAPLNIIDVREDYEVENGMIPNAVHIPMNTIPDQLHVFEKEQNYVIVCAGGVRSESVCQYLMTKGYDVTNLEGGMYSWKGEVK